MAIKEDVQRTTMSNTVVFALLDLMEQAIQGTVSGLNPELREFYKRIDTMAYQIGKGTRKPAYVATGVRKESAVSMEALGITEEDKITVGIGKFNNSAELDEDVWARIEREEREMLEKLAADGYKNVVITERRSAERLAQDEHSTDNDSIHAALMSSSNINVTDL